MSPMDAQIDILHQTSKIVSSGLTLDEMLKALIRLASQVTASDACLVYLWSSPPVRSCCALRSCRMPGRSGASGCIQAKA